MKIRNGFVSNSSSTSFCIYGIEVDTEEFDKIEDKVCKSGLEYHHNSDSGVVCIGRSWKTIKDDETGKEFKDNIKKTILTLNEEFKDAEFITIDECFFDG